MLEVVFLCLLIVQVSCVNHPKDDANAVMDSLRNALDASPESVLHEIDSLKNTGYGHSEKEKHDLDILYVSARNKTYVELNEEDLKRSSQPFFITRIIRTRKDFWNAIICWVASTVT